MAAMGAWFIAAYNTPYRLYKESAYVPEHCEDIAATWQSMIVQNSCHMRSGTD